MLSVFSFLVSLLLASASTTASAVQARAGTCNPVVTGKKLNIVNGQFQLGYPAGAFFPNVPIEAEALTIPLVPVFNVDPNISGLLSIPNPQAGGAPLYPTLVNRTQVLLEPRIFDTPVQQWSFACHNCNDPTLAYGCQVISAATAQCVQIGTAVGQTASVSQCSGLPYGNQAFNIFIS
ncbi:hypothetical protein C8J57DRAFT_1501158 [Mycena rebaudengoi]|nr:hypothetical protein C8J57DRAFT_1501158 [Mycena rebaudengoi]